MVKNLPGFYFDETKNRYFPIGSKPSTSSSFENQQGNERTNRTPATSSGSDSPSLKRKWARSTRYVMDGLRSSTNFAERNRANHALQALNISSTSLAIRGTVPTLACGAVTSFATTRIPGEHLTHALLGDTRGWIYHQAMNEEDGDEAYLGSRAWTPELNLASGISSIATAGSTCIATSFGPSCKILVQDLLSTDTYILTPGPRIVHEVWTSHLFSDPGSGTRSLAMGASGKAVWLEDVDSGREMKCLQTGSDVFAVWQQPHLMYAGCRNGSVHRFDTRLPASSPPESKQQLLFKAAGNVGAVTHFEVVNEWEAVIARTGDSLATYDLRMPLSSTPLLNFEGHVNQYMTRLPLVIDPSHSFVFAAGQDRRIRAWSLRTGQPLPRSTPTTDPYSPSPSSPTVINHPAFAYNDKLELVNQLMLEHTFNANIQSLQFVEGEGNNGEELGLWVASDEEIVRYVIGRV